MARTKLSDLAKKFVIEGILEGQTNVEILGRLEALGIECNLTQQALSYYRSLPQMRATIAMWEREALQSGLARRSVRLQRLGEIAERLEMTMAPSVGSNRSKRSDYLEGKELQVLDRYLRVLQMIHSLTSAAERRDASDEPDAQLTRLQHRQMRTVNPWYSAEDAIDAVSELELDDPDCPVLPEPKVKGELEDGLEPS